MELLAKGIDRVIEGAGFALWIYPAPFAAPQCPDRAWLVLAPLLNASRMD